MPGDKSGSKARALDAAILQIKKQYGDGALMRLGEATHLAIDAIPTGSLALDIALGIGGVPRGRVSEIYGPESAGKTTICQHIVAEAQARGGLCAYIDMEHALDPSYAARCGVDIDNLYIAQPDTGEQALEIAEALVRSGAVDVVVVDSVAALVPRAEIEGDMGDAPMGMQARLMSQALRKLSGAIKQSNTAMIFTNQLRQKIGVMFGNPETTTGGLALKFYASVRLDVRRIQSIKAGADVVGSRTRVRVTKNKVAPPFREAEFDIMYNEGISKEGDIVDLGSELEIISKRGAFFSYGDQRIGQGRENAKAFLREHPDISAAIEAAIRSQAGVVKAPLATRAADSENEEAEAEEVVSLTPSGSPPGGVAGRLSLRRWVLPAVLAAFAALAVIYSLATPIFEGPDEIWHFAFASFLADGGGLPVLSVDHPDLLLRNAAHPPLYFLPVAALIAPIDRSDFPNSFHFNLASPSITPGSHSDRPNLLIHGRNEDFPYRQTVLAVHIGRLVSIALGVLTLAGVWAVARQLAPGAADWVALATVAVAAFIPQFVYGSAIINNDALAAAGGAWTLAALLALMQRRNWRWAALSGFALGVTLLSKIGMVALAPLPLVAVALVNLDLLTKDRFAIQKKSSEDMAGRLRWAVVVLLIIYGVAAAVAGWWYLRNWILYGDPLAWKLWVVLAGVGRPTPTVAQFASDMLGLFGTFWADFGLRVDRQWAWIFAILISLALAGWVRRLARRDTAYIDVAGLLLVLAAFLLLLASAVRYSLEITDIHGRLLYPAIAAVAFFVVLGLSGWGPRPGRVLVGGTIAGLFATTLLVPFVLIAPAYARPLLPTAQLPPGAIATSVDFGGAVELVGYRLVTPRVAPNQAVHLVTYWRTLAIGPGQIANTRANMALIQLDGQQLGHVEVMLGSSVYPSSAWTPPDVIVADMVVQPSSNVNLPSVAAIWLSVRGAGPDALPTASGTTLVLARVALTGGAGCLPARRSGADFGGLIRLLGYSLQDGRLTLCWSAEQSVPGDYTVFIHLLDQTGGLLGTADSPPRNGLYPTSAWLPGEVVADERQLTLPAGATIHLGLYRPDTGERLSLSQTGETEITITP